MCVCVLWLHTVLKQSVICHEKFAFYSAYNKLLVKISSILILLKSY